MLSLISECMSFWLTEQTELGYTWSKLGAGYQVYDCHVSCEARQVISGGYSNPSLSYVIVDASSQEAETSKMSSYCPAGGDIFRGRSPADRKGATIVHLAVIPKADSSKLHLVVVTLDGRRVYMTTNPPSQGGYNAPSTSARPHGLKALIARQAPPQPAGNASRGSSST